MSKQLVVGWSTVQVAIVNEVGAVGERDDVVVIGGRNDISVPASNSVITVSGQRNVRVATARWTGNVRVVVLDGVLQSVVGAQ